MSAPPPSDPAYKVCDPNTCQPYLTENVYGVQDYPYDEYNLGLAFSHDISIGEEWLEYHMKNFITVEDLKQLQNAGITHLRVPVPHWILGDVNEDEPWIVGNRWKYFVWLCEEAKKFGFQVWPDIHSAPGSQNGFDNSGQQLASVSGLGWQNNPENVQRSLDVIRAITTAIKKENIDDVVTGLGLLNEPFRDCQVQPYQMFIEEGFNIVRSNLGPNTAVYVSDLFKAVAFNDGKWWLDPNKYNNTFLDSHYYHVFAQNPRGLTPRQHIAYACQQEYKYLLTNSGTAACCYDKQNQPSQGVKRLVGEWSVATDTLPVAVLDEIMHAIAVNGTALMMDRQLSTRRKQFLKKFAQAQIVSYEANDKGVGGGWFYWTVKMEGGAFAEWDFLRGLKEGWIPKLAPPHTPSEHSYGSCYDIIFQTRDDDTIIHQFPPPVDDSNNWQGVVLDDDVVVSHGDSLLRPGSGYTPKRQHSTGIWLLVLAVVAFAVIAIKRVHRAKRKNGYDEISGTEL